MSFLFFIPLLPAIVSASQQMSAATLIAMSDKVALHEHPLWHALLELKRGSPINDQRTVLSDPFTPRNELNATIQLLVNDASARCRYPARARFIAYVLALPDTTLKADSTCEQYATYLGAVPADAIYLVYAAENVTSASSMMGHAMLRFDGVNQQGLEVKHGITFFTELDTLNIPKLMVETLFTGKKSIFKVAPYAPYQHFYRVQEQRNVWEYQLRLSDFDRQLIIDRVWELQYENPEYFFDKYNCATLTHLLLALARPSIIDEMDRIITPIDVVRFIKNQSLLESARLIASDKWKVLSLTQNLSKETRRRLLSELETGTVSASSDAIDADQYLQHQYQMSVNTLLYGRGALSSEVFHRNQSKLDTLAQASGSYAITIDERISPLNKPKESRISVAMQHLSGNQYVSMHYYPVANSLFNDNRGTFGETQLVLSDVSARVSLNSGHAYLDRLMLYDMVSRVPFEMESRDLSSGFKFGVERVMNDNLEQVLRAISEGVIGVTRVLSSKAGFYTEIGAGATATLSKLNLFIAPRVGGYAYLSDNTKLITEYRFSYNHAGDSSTLHNLSTSLVYYASADNQFRLSVSHLKADISSTQWIAEFQHFF